MIRRLTRNTEHKRQNPFNCRVNGLLLNHMHLTSLLKPAGRGYRHPRATIRHRPTILPRLLLVNDGSS